MSSRVAPPPERFTVRRAGEPDHLAPAIAVPAAPDTSDAPATPDPAGAPAPTAPPATPELVPAGPRESHAAGTR